MGVVHRRRERFAPCKEELQAGMFGRAIDDIDYIIYGRATSLYAQTQHDPALQLPAGHSAVQW